jgi:hypothetical protein
VRYDRGMSLPIEAGRSELERRLGKETPCPQLFSTLAGGCLYSFIHRESEKAHSRKPGFRYTGFSETRRHEGIKRAEPQQGAPARW